jgi:hypothetical protein
VPGVGAWVQRFDPKWNPAEEFSPIPFDEVGEVVLELGDRVEVAADLDMVADPTRAAGYRDAAMALAPVGLARVRISAKRAADGPPASEESS